MNNMRQNKRKSIKTDETVATQLKDFPTEEE